jgi:RimJ/RimL family protein N-acetyltransferase
MQLILRPMDEASAQRILTWCYEPPYALYNVTTEELEGALAGMLDPTKLYFAATNELGELVAFYCFGPEARVAGGAYCEEALDMGAGVRPDLTGRGLGPDVLTAGLMLAEQMYNPTAIRATVAAFNLRAQRACEKVGFVAQARFVRPLDGLEFIILVRHSSVVRSHALTTGC